MSISIFAVGSAQSSILGFRVAKVLILPLERQENLHPQNGGRLTIYRISRRFTFHGQDDSRSRNTDLWPFWLVLHGRSLTQLVFFPNYISVNKELFHTTFIYIYVYIHVCYISVYLLVTFIINFFTCQIALTSLFQILGGSQISDICSLSWLNHSLFANILT